MSYLPIEIINLILSFIGPTKSSKVIKYLVDYKYNKNYNPFFYNHYSNLFNFNYSFYEWYFLIIRYKRYKLIMESN